MMNHKQFQAWLSQVDQLGTAQRREPEAVLSGGSQASASLAAIEAGVGEDRRCPHCGTPGAVSRGKARGLRRHQCKNCGKTFNAATGTPVGGSSLQGEMAGVRNLPCGRGNGACVRRALRACRRHGLPRKLAGIAEADETHVPESRKGERHLDRKARRRGGTASRRGLSSGRVPVLVAADRSGMTVGAVLPAVNADALRDVIEPVVDEDIVLVSDGHRACPPCAAAMGVRREAPDLSGGERVRTAFHVQAVNGRHGQLKGFPRRCRGIATEYLDNCLQWFQHVELDNASPRTCLANAIGRSCMRFGNEPSDLTGIRALRSSSTRDFRRIWKACGRLENATLRSLTRMSKRMSRKAFRSTRNACA